MTSHSMLTPSTAATRPSASALGCRRAPLISSRTYPGEAPAIVPIRLADSPLATIAAASLVAMLLFML